MTTATFDRATYGAMSVTEIAAAFEQIVGEPPEKRNKLWMLKRMEQAASAQAAARRAVTRATEDDEGSEVGAPAVAAAVLAPEEPVQEAAPPTTLPSAESEAGAIAVEEAPCGAAAAADEPVTTDVAEAVAHEEEPIPGGDDHEEMCEEDGADAPGPAPEGAPRGADDVAARRRYIPLRFRAMSIPDLHALYLATVGRPTKSIDVPYLAWKIKRAELRAGTAPAPRRRSVGTDGVPRGEAKAVTLREYPDTLAALEGVCMRHGFRNRLDFFRTAARCYLEEIGEAATAAYFSAPGAAPRATIPAP